MMSETPNVSVLICTFNEGPLIGECIDSILCQTCSDFELIIIDDGSTDNTAEIVESYRDPRIRYFKCEKNTGMMGRLRRAAVSKARGEFVFFTDADCTARRDWVEMGLRAFHRHDTFAVEGRIVYYQEGYAATLADIKKSNETGGLWMTGNMTYRRAILERHSFDDSYRALEDRELGLRVSRLKPIPFVREMVVYHCKEERGVAQFFSGVEKIYIREKIRLRRQHNDKNDLFQNPLRIYDPGMLLLMFFPPLILAEFFMGRLKSWNDLKLLPFLWPKAIYLRWSIWSAAIKEKILII